MLHLCTTARLTIAMSFVLLAASGCGTSNTYDVEPLRADGPGADKPSTDETPQTPETASPSPEPEPTTQPTTQPTTSPSTEPVQVVADLLARYSRLAGLIAADPSGAPPPGSPTRNQWDELVEPGSALSADVMERFHQRATVDRVVIVPGVDGVTFRHRVTSIADASDSTIGFKWCGWSPGIGRRIDDGAVVDDTITASTGTGTAVFRDGLWHLAELEEDERQVLAPGSSDPCGDDPPPTTGGLSERGDQP